MEEAEVVVVVVSGRERDEAGGMRRREEEGRSRGKQPTLQSVHNTNEQTGGISIDHVSDSY